MKVLITGANGQLGFDLCRTLNSHEIIPITHADCDITNIASVKNTLARYHPDIVINTAAYVRVDDCEDHQDEAFLVNALGARNVAVAAVELGAKLVHISTDYVFGGKDSSTSGGFNEFEAPQPLNVYGKSKLAGENFVRHLCRRYFIIRSSALFGVSGARSKGGNFVETIIKLAKERNELRVINDQFFSPTYTLDLAQKINQLISTELYGIYHITNRGTCSWYDLSKEILKSARLETPIIPVSSDEYPQKTRRPNNSVLDNYHLRLLGMDDLRGWSDALKDYMRCKGYIE